LKFPASTSETMQMTLSSSAGVESQIRCQKKSIKKSLTGATGLGTHLRKVNIASLDKDSSSSETYVNKHKISGKNRGLFQ
jgi:hypothetical protein